jgi:ribosomal protein S18 acetylase RimI-like enzyme
VDVVVCVVSEVVLPAPLACHAATPRDDAFLAALYRATRSDLLAMPVAPAMIDQLIAMQQRMQAQSYRLNYSDAPDCVLTRMAPDGSVQSIGKLTVSINPQRVQLVDIALSPDVRGLGLGTVVVQALQALARAQNTPLCLSVSTQNPHAKRLYLRLGFVSDPVSDGAVDGGSGAEAARLMSEPLIWYPAQSSCAPAQY